MKVFSLVWLPLTSKVITSVANLIGQSAFPLILKDTFQLKEHHVG